MISSINSFIWTERGWMQPIYLAIGDKVISYSQKRNCTEYDEISSIQMDFKTTKLLGMRAKAMNLFATPDHPILVYDKITKEIERIPIKDAFLNRFTGRRAILHNRWFEPYNINLDMEDVRWSARVASTFSHTRVMPEKQRSQIWNVIKDINGIEAQEWITTAFHWNVLSPGVNWMKTIDIKNKDLEDMIFHVAPRAGLGAKKYADFRRLKTKGMHMSVSKMNDISCDQNNWFQDRLTTSVFNIATRNGNFLMRRFSGTAIYACGISEENNALL